MENKETMDIIKEDIIKEYIKYNIPFKNYYFGPEQEADKIVKFSLLEQNFQIIYSDHTVNIEEQQNNNSKN